SFAGSPAGRSRAAWHLPKAASRALFDAKLRAMRHRGLARSMMSNHAADAPASSRKPWYKILYVQVLIAIVLGAIVGWLFPEFAKGDWIKALGDGFVKLIRMVIAPIIFCTVVSGIAHIQEAKKVGRVAVKAL